jgi:hypothetical protein
MHTEFWSGKLKSINYSEDLCVNWKIIVDWILWNSVGGCRPNSSGLE